MVDHHVQHPRDRPGELDDLVDDEAHVPAEPLADEPLDVGAHHLLRLDRHGDVDVRTPVDQRKRLPEAGAAVETDRGELEEQLVELAFETGGEIPRGASPPDLGVDLGHHLVEVADPLGGIVLAVSGRTGRRRTARGPQVTAGEGQSAADESQGPSGAPAERVPPVAPPLTRLLCTRAWRNWQTRRV